MRRELLQPRELFRPLLGVVNGAAFFAHLLTVAEPAHGFVTGLFARGQDTPAPRHMADCHLVRHFSSQGQNS